mgnify:FL=1
MRIFYTPKITKNFKGSALAIGNFDGVHRGHQKVFLNAKNFAKKNKVKFGILTFKPLPIMFFNKDIKNYRLVSEENKLNLLKKHGVDFVIKIKFNRNFSKISADSFIQNIIYKKISPKFIFVSDNFKFGNKRKGNVNLLKKFGTKYNYYLKKISPLKYKKKIISSTRIRKLLEKGSLNLANKLLSRTWFVEGNVIKGKGRGRKLGYRTCNMKIKDYLLPKFGIYAVKIFIKNFKKKYDGVAYLGSRPTYKEKAVILETYIFGIKKNLYKKSLKIYFLKFLRKDKKFKNSEKLVEQMNKDLIYAKKGLKRKLIL